MRRLQSEIEDQARFCPACGAEQPKVNVQEGEDPLLGKVVASNFRIEKLLGEGGMGKVYKARQLSLDKDVVIKVLHDHFRDDPQLVQRFQREARAASRLNHPNSIQVIDFGQDDSGVLFMAIEYLKGTDLFTVLQSEGAFTEQRIARIMVQVCSALADAHEMNVIHRDLKPENIMIEDRRGRKDIVKVLDFGIAKIQDPDEAPGQALTQAGMVCGTPEYMSPEQARGQGLDARSDLYSIGVLSYQLATGGLPFAADTPIAMVTKHILEEPEPPRERAPDLGISEGMETVIMRAMAKDRDERFQNAVDLGAAFEALITGGSVVDQPSVSNPGQPAAGAVPQTKPDTEAVSSSSATLVRSPIDGPPTGGLTKTSPTPTGLEAPVDEPPPQTGPNKGMLAAAAIAGVVLLVGIVMATRGGGDPEPPPIVAAVEPAAPGTPKDPQPTDVKDPKPTDTVKKPKPKDPKPKDPKPQVPAKDPKPKDAKPKPGDTTTKPADKKPGDRVATAKSAKRVKAEKLLASANRLMAKGKKKAAYDKAKAAIGADPSYAEPRQLISNYHRLAGNSKKSCAAIKDYVRLKGKALSKKKVERFLKVAGCP